MENKCKICGCKPYFDHNESYSLFGSSIELASGGWTDLRAGKNENNKVIMYGLGDGETDLYYPKYCPECGRKLQ